jgi:hypothetical protein
VFLSDLYIHERKRIFKAYSAFRLEKIFYCPLRYQSKLLFLGMPQEGQGTALEYRFMPQHFRWDNPYCALKMKYF